jgi:transposase
MITATTLIGIDVSRDWLDGFCFPGERRFRLGNSAEGHDLLVSAIREMPGPVKIGFEATGGQEWVLWATLVAAGIDSKRRLCPIDFALARRHHGVRRRPIGSSSGTARRGRYAPLACWAQAHGIRVSMSRAG